MREDPSPSASARSHWQPIPTGPLPEALALWASEHGYAHLELGRQWERMLDWHRKEGKLSADWPASWRTWLGREKPQDVPSVVTAEDSAREHQLSQLRSRLAANRRMVDPDPEEIAELESALAAMGAEG